MTSLKNTRCHRSEHKGLWGKESWVAVAADLMEFPLPKKQEKYLVDFQDSFTRWSEIKAISKSDGKSVATALEELVIFRWGRVEFENE